MEIRKTTLEILVEHKDEHGFYPCKKVRIEDAVHCDEPEAPAYDMLCIKYLNIKCIYYESCILLKPEGVPWAYGEEE